MSCAVDKKGSLLYTGSGQEVVCLFFTLDQQHFCRGGPTRNLGPFCRISFLELVVGNKALEGERNRSREALTLSVFTRLTKLFVNVKLKQEDCISFLTLWKCSQTSEFYSVKLNVNVPLQSVCLSKMKGETLLFYFRRRLSHSK